MSCGVVYLGCRHAYRRRCHDRLWEQPEWYNLLFYSSGEMGESGEHTRRFARIVPSSTREDFSSSESLSIKEVLLFWGSRFQQTRA
jgi:hypothetical protein